MADDVFCSFLFVNFPNFLESESDKVRTGAFYFEGKSKQFLYILGRYFNRNTQVACEVNQNKLKYASQIFVLEGLYAFYFIENISFVTWKIYALKIPCCENV